MKSRRLMQPSKEAQGHAKVEAYHIEAWESGGIGGARCRARQPAILGCAMTNPDFLLGAARPLPPSADIGSGGQSVGPACAILLRLHLAVRNPQPKTPIPFRPRS